MMHRQGGSNLDPREEYVGNSSGVINLDLTLAIPSTLNEGAQRNLVNGRQEVFGSINANGKSTVSLPLKRNRQFLGESSSRVAHQAHQAAPSSENYNGSQVINSVFSQRNLLPSNGRKNLEPFHDRERFDEIGRKTNMEADHISNSHFHDQMGSRLVLGRPATLNTISPCAACRLLRKRCTQECPFAPYFSPYEPHKFASVHKVFGASNISKMLKDVPESQRADVANSLVYDAKLRLRDPVHGCMGAISALQQRVQSLQAELNAVRAEMHKYQLREANNMNLNMNIIPSSSHHHVTKLPSSVSIAAAAPPPTSSSPSSNSLCIQQRGFFHQFNQNFK